MTEQSAQLLFNENLKSYVAWPHPVLNRKLYMHSAALRAISAASLQGLKAKPASEIGGLLWGKILTTMDDTGAESTIIDTAEFIPTKSILYNTTSSDRQVLAQAVLTTKNRNNDCFLIGYFRSHVRSDLCLSQEDEEFVKQNIYHPKQICLLVRPFEMGVCMAGFFFWHDGHLQTDASELEVPFILPAESAAKEPPAVRLSAESNLAATPYVECPLSPGEASRKPIISIPGEFNSALQAAKGHSAKMEARQHTGSAAEQQRPGNGLASAWPFLIQQTWRLIILVLAFGLAATLGAATFFALPTLRSYFEFASESASGSEVDLQVARVSTGQINLSWNRSVASLARTRGGKLTITENQVHNELKLDNAQLRSGKVSYFSSGADMEFCLEIYLDNGHTLTESVRVVVPS